MIGNLGETDSRRTLVVVAHPDDETFGTGSLLLHLADTGAVTAVCCASRGEAGDIRPDVATLPGGIGDLREAELRDAADLLGVSDIYLLDLVDSGMTGAPPAGSIVCVPLADAVGQVSRVVTDFRPDAIVTLDGSDGHRDHARIRDAAVVAGREHGIPVWLHCLPRHLMRSWAEHLAHDDPASPYLALADLGTPDEAVTVRIDTAAHYTRRCDAIARHRSQTSPFDALPDDLRREFLTSEHLRPADPADPDQARHHHGPSTCYWNFVECRWSCREAASDRQPVGTV